MKPNWYRVVSFKTELLSEYLIQKGYQEDLLQFLPKIGLLKNRMIIDNDIYVDLNEVEKIQNVLSKDILSYGYKTYTIIEKQSEILLSIVNEAVRDIEGISKTELEK